MDVAVKTTGSKDFAFARNDFRAGSNNDVYIWLCVRVSCFADPVNTTVF